jgi:fluoroacetyl-CoA thioesterase
LCSPEHLVNQFNDAMLPPVPVTPVIVLAMEKAALDAIRSFLEEGESAVGTEIDVHYLCNERRSLRAPPVGKR